MESISSPKKSILIGNSDEKEYTAVGIVDGKLLYNDHNHLIKKDFFLSNLYITVSVSPYVKCTQLSLFS